MPRRPRERLGTRLPWLLRDPTNVTYLDSYDAVVGVSQYTVDWIGRLWERDAEVLYPPIQVDRFHPAQQRARSIISAGRFFAPGSGHAKRQLEQVQTFARLVRAGQLTGWTLHMVGGCEPSQHGYLDTVRAAGEGIPVEVHANAPRHVLEDLMSTAAIQWSATGYGEDESKKPWNAEHFGMTTVEAMAGGCVPIVIDKAGQKEIITPGVDGYRWSTPAQLKQQTARIAGDEALRARLSAAAVRRSATFSDEAFADRWQEIAAENGLLG